MKPNTPDTKLEPLAQQILTLLRNQGHHGLSAMDAMRSLGVSGGSFTKRLSDLRKAGVKIKRDLKRDPLTKRLYGRYKLAA